MRHTNYRRAAYAIALMGILGSTPNFGDCWDDQDCVAPTREGSPSLQAGQSADIHQISQTFGHLVGREIKAQDLDLDIDDVINGLRAALAGRRAPMSEQGICGSH